MLPTLLTTVTSTPAHMTVLFTKGVGITELVSIFHSLYGTFESRAIRNANRENTS